MSSSWFSRKESPNTNTTPPSTPSRPTAATVAVTRPPSTADDDKRQHAEYAWVFALGVTVGIGGTFAWRRWGMRLCTAEWVTPNVLAHRRWIKGVVTSVGDADDFRLYHTPGFGWRGLLRFRRVPMKRKDLKDQTIHVRIAGVDAPEGAHYGRPGQPHAKESLTWLRNRILGKTVYCQFIRKDQYGRVVAAPLVPRPYLPLFLSKFVGSSLALEMLRAGTAMIYTESGAEYGPWGRETFLRVEKEAKAARRGMWRNGVNIESPMEYKKRYAAALGMQSEEEDNGR